MKATFNIGKERKEGDVVKDNIKTVWVKFEYQKNVAEAGVEALFKTFTNTIKRHKLKHSVVMEG